MTDEVKAEVTFIKATSEFSALISVKWNVHGQKYGAIIPGEMTTGGIAQLISTVIASDRKAISDASEVKS